MSSIFNIPEDMVVLIDTREQYPLFTNPVRGLQVERTMVKHGDYTIKGFENGGFFAERKRKSDLWTYCAADRDNTKRKLEEASKFLFRCLLVESTEANLYKEDRHIPVVNNVLRESLISFELKYGLHIYYNPDPDMLEAHLLRLMLKFLKYEKSGELFYSRRQE